MPSVSAPVMIFLISFTVSGNRPMQSTAAKLRTKRNIKAVNFTLRFRIKLPLLRLNAQLFCRYINFIEILIKSYGLFYKGVSWICVGMKH